MKKSGMKKKHLAVFAVLVLFVFVSVMSVSSIRLLQGNARVVNYVGIVRGATQKLIKEELMGWHILQTYPGFAADSDWYPDDALVARLDSIVDELLTGVGPNNLVVLQDETYLGNMLKVRAHWTLLKELIAQVRAGANPQKMFDSSQVYFELVNDTVFSAEAYSENQVKRIDANLMFANGMFVLLVAIGLTLYLRGLAAKRHAEALGRIAYIDPLTRLDNRASCERLIARYQNEPPEQTLAVFMFDMNDLKQTNDLLGHQEGDRIISAFAQSLKNAADSGFIGRFGGDEFLAVFERGDSQAAERFLRGVRERVDAYNREHPNLPETIRYAVGYVIASAAERDIMELIHEADNRMYENKRELKGFPQPVTPEAVEADNGLKTREKKRTCHGGV